MTKLDENAIKQIDDLFWKNLMFFNKKVLVPQLGEIREDIGVLKKDVGTLKSDVAEIKDDIRKMDRKLDLVSEKVTDIEYDHDRRLKRVEKDLALV